MEQHRCSQALTLALVADRIEGPFSNSLSIIDVLYCGEVTLSLVRVLKMLTNCQRKTAPDIYVAYTNRSQDTGKLFATELGQFPTCGPPFCRLEGLKTGLTLALLLSILLCSVVAFT